MSLAILYNKYTLYAVDNKSVPEIIQDIIQVDSLYTYLRSSDFTEIDINKIDSSITGIINVNVVDNHKAISYYARCCGMVAFKLAQTYKDSLILPQFHTVFIDEIVENLNSNETQNLYDYDLKYLSKMLTKGHLTYSDFKQLINFVEAYKTYSTIILGKDKLYIEPKMFNDVTKTMIIDADPVWDVLKIVIKYFDNAGF